MNREDIIRMAREAGAGNLHGEWSLFGHVALERFAALVAAAELRRLHTEKALLENIKELQAAQIAQLLEALELAEAGLADIGDADREPGDDLAWCERRAAEPLPVIRDAIAAAKGEA
jgi:hypothetical protein